MTMIKMLQSHQQLTGMETTWILSAAAAMVMLSLAFGPGALAAGRSQLQQSGAQGSYTQQKDAELGALESVLASGVEYVDGPLAPLYDFLIQRRLFKFCKLLRDAGLEEMLQGLGSYWTLFVPTDASFIFLPGGTLENLKRNPQQLRDFILYHFVNGDFPSSMIVNEMLVDSVQGSPLRFNIYGQITTVSGAQIVEPDLQFELGRVHIVDHPLYPVPTGDTVSYLRTSHPRLYRLLLDAGLIDYLSSGTFTILAPDDDAFNFLSEELKDALSANRSLAERVLLNHILPGSIYTGGIVDGMRWDTVGGSVINFTTKRGLIFANGIPIVLPDVPFTNGVIHALNRVILPEGVEADCQCKPTSVQQPPSQTQGGFRPPFGQPQRPQGQTTRPNEQILPGRTSRPSAGQTPNTINQVRPSGGQTTVPLNPGVPAQQPQRPFTPSRIGQPVRPQPTHATRSPFDRPVTQPQLEDDTNTVVGPGFQPSSFQRKPDQTRTTRYPPLPGRVPSSHTPGIPAQPPRGLQPQTVSDNDVHYPGQDIAPQVTNTPRQTSRWSNRQPTQVPRYPTPARTTFRAPATTRRPQTTRAYNRVTPPTNGRIPNEIHSDQVLTTPNPQQEFQTQRTTSRTTSWQQRQQITRTTRRPTQPRTSNLPRVPPPPQRRPTPGRPITFPTTASGLPQVTDQPFESNRETSNCRQRGERITPSTQNLPLCPETDDQGCQNPPYNPADRRPLCPPDVSRTNCRRPNEPFNPSDRRPLCPSPVTGQDCRIQGQPTYAGDRRPFCSPSPPSSTGCRDPSAPFNPADNRPLCSTTSSINNVTPPQQTTPTQGCRRPDEPTNLQDRRPLCPVDVQEDCRPFFERPKAGDRRPVCKINRQPAQPTPTRANNGQRPGKVPQTQQRPTHSQNTRPPNTQTTRRQSWQPTTPAPQTAMIPTINPNQQQIGQQIPGSGNQRPFIPSSQPQRGTFQTRPQTNPRHPQPGSVSQPHTSFNPSEQQPGSHTSQPQPGPGLQQPQPGSGLQQPQPVPGVSQPQPGSDPTQLQPGSGLVQPQTGPNPSQPHTGSRHAQPQSPGIRPLPPSPGPSRQTPRQPTPTRTISIPTLRPGSHTQGPYPQQGAGRTIAPFQTSPYPANQGNRPTGSGTRPGSSQPFVPQRPVSPPRQPTGSVIPQPGRGTSTPRVPVSVIGTSTTPGEDTRRTLYEIVEDPALLIRGQPVKLTKVLDLFIKAGLEDILLGPGPTTVFLPADDAFSMLPRGVVEQLEENPQLLRQVLLYHVTNVEILPTAQGDSYTVPSMEGTLIPITMLNGGRLILISGAKAIAVTRANNGIFYVINQLLYPLPHNDVVSAIQSRPDLSTLSWLLSLSGLTDLLQNQTPYTFLAPTDNAFAQLPPAALDELTQNTTALQELLLNHIFEGAHYGREFLTGGTFPNARGGKLKFQVVSYGYQVNDVDIKTPEIVTGTGVVHLIDQVLLEEPDLQFFNRLDNSVTGPDDIPVDGQQPQANQFQPRPPSSVGVNPASAQPVQPAFGGQRPPSSVGANPASAQPVFRGQRPPSSVGANPASAQPVQPAFGGQRPPSSVGANPASAQPVQPAFGGQRPPSSVGANPASVQPAFGGQRPPSSVGANPASAQPVQPAFGGQRLPHGQNQMTGLQPAVGQRVGPQRTPSSQHNVAGQRQSQNSGHSSFGVQRIPLNQPQTSGQPSHGNRSPSLGTSSFTGQRQPAFQPNTLPVVNNANGQPANVADLARAMGLNRFANWITNTGLLEKIHDGGVYTVFAPTDEAVNSLPQEMVYSIDTNPQQTMPLLQYHIIPRRLDINSVSNDETSSTLLQGKPIRFNVYPSVQPNCKQLVTASGTPIGDALATMGSIQVIPVTQVLYQPTGNIMNIIDASPILTSLSEAIKSARLSWQLSGSGPLTFFAPSNTAFESLTPEERKALIDDKKSFTELLKRHLVRGTYFSSGVQEDLQKSSENGNPLTISLQEGILTVNSVPVSYSDITATNGVLHVIDQFL